MMIIIYNSVIIVFILYYIYIIKIDEVIEIVIAVQKYIINLNI